MLFICVNILHAGYFTGFQSTGTYIDTFRLTVYKNTDLLDVNAPGALVFVVSMGNVVTGFRRSACYITFTGHE